MLLGGLSQQHKRMYETAIEVSKKHNFFRPMTIDNRDILVSAMARGESESRVTLEANAQHLVCYVGGMMAIAAKIFLRPNDLSIARKLVDGCIWSYEIMPAGIMAETFFVVPCENGTSCTWDEKKWHEDIIRRNDFVTENIVEKIKELGLIPGISQFTDRRYILR